MDNSTPMLEKTEQDCKVIKNVRCSDNLNGVYVKTIPECWLKMILSVAKPGMADDPAQRECPKRW